MRVEQRVEVEDRRHLAADLGERLERVDVLALRSEQARVLDRHGDVRGELAQQRLVLARERAFGLVQQVQRADDLALAAHRHRELRQHVAQRPHVARLLADVVDQDRTAFLDGGADDALPHLQPHASRRPLRDSRRRSAMRSSCRFSSSR